MTLWADGGLAYWLLLSMNLVRVQSKAEMRFFRRELSKDGTARQQRYAPKEAKTRAHPLTADSRCIDSAPPPQTLFMAGKVTGPSLRLPVKRQTNSA